MERILLQKLNLKTAFLYLALITFGFAGAQTISIPTVSSNPLEAEFTLTNGNSSNLFKAVTVYNYILMPGDVNFGNFSIGNPPTDPNSFQSYKKTINAPLGTQGGTYSVKVKSNIPNVTSGVSNTFTLTNDFEIDDQDFMGYIHCQTPAVSYRLITLTNTGNIIDKYTLGLDENAVKSEQSLNSTIIELSGTQITETPVLIPGESYTFMIRFEALQGTQPDKHNYTDLIITPNNENTLNKTIELHSYVYCGNGNNIPGGTGSPDLKITKTSQPAKVGESFLYTITLSNTKTENAITPTIIDTIPANLTVVDYYLGEVLGQPDERSIFLTYDEPTRLFQAVYPTNNKNKFDVNSYPITIYIEAIPDCYAPPSIINTAYVYNSAGDFDDSNNNDSTITSVNYDTSIYSELGNWTGKVSNNWFDCRNWSKGLIPDSSINVSIPSSASNQPVIDDTSIALAKSLDIEIGASLTMQSNSNLQISGNWTNIGTFNPGNGTVAFVGSNDQQIVDILSTPTFYSLKINTNNNSKVQIINDQGLFVNNQLNLKSGILRLEGMSQLIQPNGATVVATTGKLWRDQQGQANLYNYNYWSSPVGTSGTHYTVAGVMKDGTTGVPQNITWVGGHNGAPTSPISISTHWLYKFESTGPLYANWQKINQNTSIQAGLGYTMKGSGAAGGSQNYTFEGVPFTGDIEQIISDGQISLLGNPYASAIDANQFIIDNDGIIDGTLEFWDHFETTNSHVLAMYKGGYAKYNLSEKIRAVNSDSISDREPQRFIPVGQGFFVAAANGIQNNSQIVFKNSQRAFVRENDTDGMQMFGSPEGANSNPVNLEEPTRIRLNMVSSDNYTHQIAIGFMGDNATEGIDYGYDALLKDTDPNQFYFMHPEAKLLIQGVGYFDIEKNYPLGIIANVPGRYTFSIDRILNLVENAPVYLYDNEKQIYHNLRNSDYYVNLPQGEHNTRFSLRFKNHSLESNMNTQEMLNAIVVYRQNDRLIIANPTEQLTILSANMFNVLGQEVSAWNISNGRDSYIELPLRPLAAGIYVVQVQTDNGVVSKKINIR